MPTEDSVDEMARSARRRHQNVGKRLRRGNFSETKGRKANFYRDLLFQRGARYVAVVMSGLRCDGSKFSYTSCCKPLRLPLAQERGKRPWRGLRISMCFASSKNRALVGKPERSPDLKQSSSYIPLIVPPLVSTDTPPNSQKPQPTK